MCTKHLFLLLDLTKMRYFITCAKWKLYGYLTSKIPAKTITLVDTKIITREISITYMFVNTHSITVLYFPTEHCPHTQIAELIWQRAVMDGVVYLHEITRWWCHSKDWSPGMSVWLFKGKNWNKGKFWLCRIHGKLGIVNNLRWHKKHT